MPQTTLFDEAITFHRKGELDRAADAYRAVLKNEPQHLTSLHMLGVIERDTGNLIEARLLLAKAEELSSDSAELSFDIGLLLIRSEEPKVAVQYFTRAVTLDPELGPGWHYLGRLYRRQCEPEKAEQCFHKAISILTSSISSELELAHVELALGKAESARSRIEALIQTINTVPEYWSALSQSHWSLGVLDDAIVAMERAVELNGDRVDDLFILARMYIARGTGVEALAIYQGLQKRWPENYKVAANQAGYLFSIGQFEDAWHLYRQRYKRLGPKGRELKTNVPEWNGKDISGKRLILTADEDLGEQILFMRFVPELCSRAEVLAVEVDRRLLPIARRTFPDVNFVPWTKPTHEDVLRDDADFHGVLGDFGLLLRTCAEDFNVTPPRFEPELDVAAEWRDKIRGATGSTFVVGLSYASEKSPMSMEKSVALSQLSGLAAIEGVTFVNLQYGRCREYLNQWAKDVGITLLDFPEIDPTHDLDTHAAMILATDLVVSVSTATAHIAAGLGHPTWVLLPRAQPSFLYWSRAGDNETWYPSVQKVAPGPGENWTIVADKIVEMIESRQGR